MNTRASLLLLVFLAACSLQPVYERPAAPVASNYPAGPAYKDVAGAPTPAADIGWRDFLNDERLRRLVETALKNNRDLRVAALTVVSVPGSLEVPLALQKLANTEKYDALIALGAVIRGETYHFEIVANESASGLMQVQLDSGIPVANGILTADTEEQAQERAPKKGRDCAEAAVEMANLARNVAKSHR